VSADKTIIQPALKADWDYWDSLQRTARAAYDAEKARGADEVLRRLGPHYPGIRGQGEMVVYEKMDKV